MRLPFLDRAEELRRLKRALRSADSRLVVVYGRRRCGKSRLVEVALRGLPHVYYLADERESALQRAALASQIARLLPGFDRVRYPDWDALLERFARGSRGRSACAIRDRSWKRSPLGAVCRGTGSSPPRTEIARQQCVSSS